MQQPLPAWVVKRIAEKAEAGWTGKMGLNWRGGKVIELEFTERDRGPGTNAVD